MSDNRKEEMKRCSILAWPELPEHWWDMADSVVHKASEGCSTGN